MDTDKLKNALGKVVESATEFAKEAVEKTSSLASQTKLNFSISETESKIKSIYEELGSMVYKQYKNDNSLDSAVQEKCEKIDKLKEEIRLLKEKIAELKEAILCPYCGTYNQMDHTFCSKCGRSLKDDENDENVQTEDNADFVSTQSEEINEDTVVTDTQEKTVDFSDIDHDTTVYKNTVTIKPRKPIDDIEE